MKLFGDFLNSMQKLAEKAEKEKQKQEEQKRRAREAKERAERKAQAKQQEISQEKKVEEPVMTSERNLIDEIDYMSGLIYANEIFTRHIAKILIASGAIDGDSLYDLINQISNEIEIGMADKNQPAEFHEGYRSYLTQMIEGVKLS